MNTNTEQQPADLGFAYAAKDKFAFLEAQGFAQVESRPTLVRYRKADVEVDVYHGRQSFELGVGITRYGNHYSLSDLIRATDGELAKHYRNPTATTQFALAGAVAEVAVMLQRYGGLALQGDPAFFTVLARERKRWAQDYSLEVLAQQIRPRAHEAFRLGNYTEAAQLYKQIESLLTPVERQKLAIAETRSRSR